MIGVNNNQLVRNSIVATVWSSGVLPGKVSGAAEARRKNGAQAVG
tara:strand:- start:3319 stop:3453 length:135 start_codon:yes stop_codon:yes gene_type:complete